MTELRERVLTALLYQADDRPQNDDEAEEWVRGLEADALDADRLATALHGSLFACGLEPITDTAHAQAHRDHAAAIVDRYRTADRS